MNATPPDPGTTDAPLARGVLTIVLAGIALGAAFNAMLLDADPTHAIPWVRSERRVVTLEKVSGSGLPAGPGDTASAGHAAHTTAAPSAAAAARATRPEAHAATVHDAPRSAVASAPRTPPAAPSASPGRAAPRPPAAAAVSGSPLPAIPESADPMEASLDVLKAYQAQGAALVLDARPAGEYAEGHIAGAINLPFDDVFKHPELVKNLSPGARPVITYCGGGDCELSRNLAFAFVDAGCRRVLVFTAGLPSWTAAGLPTHTGTQP